ncbi:N-acetylglutamate synthase, partial [mine drainage metagenome]
MDPEQFIRGFRESSPYIHRFRGQTFVISLEDESLSDGTLSSIASDVALLRSLGIGIILVFGVLRKD